jgi:dihydrofolate synthase/folylpolyglutamate synthase
MQFWFGRVNFEQKTPLADDLKLDRIRTLLARLGNPQDQLRIVHIAGSKGKGSTAAMLGAMLQAVGYRTGLFTSPHLAAVEERIQVDRQPIPAAELIDRMDEIRIACTGSDLASSLTFFEICTALGFLHFARRGAELAVVEVGLGGRFDSTNVCRPLAAIVTSISLDHTQVLGETTELIAREKAGIIKAGRPTISGVREPGPRRIIAQTCAERGSPLRQLGTDFDYRHEPALIDTATERMPVVDIHTWHRDWPALPLGLIGEHQAHNAAIAVAAACLLGDLGVPIPEVAIRHGLAHVIWPARLEIMSRRPLAVLDCAHNVASAQALVQALATSFPRARSGRRLLVFAGSRDKDLAGMLNVLAPPFDRIVLTRFRDSPRATPPEELVAMLPAEKRAFAAVVASAAEAWRLARGEACENDLICVTGSVFLAGELRALMAEEA